MMLGVSLAIIVTLSFYAYIFDKNWFLLTGFPVGWISASMSYMIVFFHEIGHTIFMWFYGYPAIPTFDFKHGGGMSWPLFGQQIIILIIIWSIMGYGLWLFKGYLGLQIAIALLFLLNIGFAFNDYHKSVFTAMGHISESLIASFFLYRVLFNLVPRGDLERFLNAFFGFGIIFHSLIECYGLLKNEAFRLVYYQQKGSHGFGDLDKLSSDISILSFSSVVLILMVINILCLTIPFVLYYLRKDYVVDNFNSKWF